MTGGERPLGVHHAASIRFVELGGRLHLLVEPRYFFTTDGFNPVEGAKAGRYSVPWGNKEGNRTVLRRMLMWPRILSGGRSDISLMTGGPEPITVGVAPCHGRSNRGILGDAKDILTLLEGEEAGEVFEDGDALDAVAAEHALAQLESDGDAFSGDDEADRPELDAEGEEPDGGPELELPFNG